jgi:parvulin-like peptidyl-prolyl cis-trans isomerase-like protein
MRFFWFLCLLLSSMAFAQTARPVPQQNNPPQKNPAASRPADADEEGQKETQAKPAQPNIPPDAAVITIKGMCNDNAATGGGSTAGCQTVITRADFEKLADALQPKMPPAVRQRLAGAYPKMLVMAHEAQKRGLEKDPHFQEMMQFARLQILNQELNKNLQEQAAKVPDKDIADYYKDNTAAYEQATLLRIFIPKRKQLEPPKEGAKPADTKAQEQAAEEAMTKEAEALRTRAAAGEDFEKLQKEAFEAAAIKGSAPSVDIGKMRRTNLPPSQAAAYELKSGEVSQVVSDPSGHYIFKMVSKEVLPLEQVKDEIHATLQNQRLKDALQAIQQSTTTELNEAYFGSAPSANPSPAPVAAPGRPKSGAASNDPSKTPPPEPK